VRAVWRDLVWQAARADAAPTLRLYGNWGRPRAHRAAVYLVSPAEVSASLFIFVPGGCRCVILRPDAFGRWLQERRTGTGRRHVEDDALLAFMLLHEAGHIDAQRTVAPPVDGAAVDGAPADAIVSKAQEEYADAYAVARMRRHLPTSRSQPAWSAVVRIQLALEALAWNLFATRMLDHFGATTLKRPEVFADAGNTHPNLELRIMTVNHDINPSEASRRLLDDFRERRTAAAPPGGILFKRMP
jgi:hypothetical protein